jgi:hypothetical protein
MKQSQDLLEELKSCLNGDFQDAVEAMVTDPVLFDVQLLHRALFEVSCPFDIYLDDKSVRESDKLVMFQFLSSMLHRFKSSKVQILSRQIITFDVLLTWEIYFDLKLLSNWYILTKGTSKNNMDTKYHKAAYMTSGCRVGTNIISLIRYKNDWGGQQHP